MASRIGTHRVAALTTTCPSALKGTPYRYGSTMITRPPRTAAIPIHRRTDLLLLAERDGVAFWISDGCDSFSPRHVFWLAKDFDPQLPKLPEQFVHISHVHIHLD